MRDKPDYLAHAILGLGVVLFALPVWLVLAGSTQDSDAITRGELSLIPRLGNFDAYARVLTEGTMGTQPVWHMLLVSLGMALAIALGKIVISVLSAYAVVFFRFPFRRARRYRRARCRFRWRFGYRPGRSARRCRKHQGRRDRRRRHRRARS